MLIPAAHWSLTIVYNAADAPNDTQIIPCPGNLPTTEIIATLRAVADQLQAQVDAAQPSALPPAPFAPPADAPEADAPEAAPGETSAAVEPEATA